MWRLQLPAVYHVSHAFALVCIALKTATICYFHTVQSKAPYGILLINIESPINDLKDKMNDLPIPLLASQTSAES